MDGNYVAHGHDNRLAKAPSRYDKVVVGGECVGGVDKTVYRRRSEEQTAAADQWG